MAEAYRDRLIGEPRSQFPQVDNLPDGGVSKFYDDRNSFSGFGEKEFTAELPIIVGNVPQAELEFARICPLPNEYGSYYFLDSAYRKTNTQPISDLRKGMPTLFSLVEQDMQRFDTQLDWMKIDRRDTPAGTSPNSGNTGWHRDPILSPIYIVSDCGGTEFYKGEVHLAPQYSGTLRPEDRLLQYPVRPIAAPDGAIIRLSKATLHRAPLQLPEGKTQRIFIKMYAQTLHDFY